MPLAPLRHLEQGVLPSLEISQLEIGEENREPADWLLISSEADRVGGFRNSIKIQCSSLLDTKLRFIGSCTTSRSDIEMSNLLRRLSVNLERQLGSGNDSGRESHSFKGCPSFNDFSLHASDDRKWGVKRLAEPENPSILVSLPLISHLSLFSIFTVEDHSHEFDRYQTQHKEETTGRSSFETKPVPVIIGSAPAGKKKKLFSCTSLPLLLSLQPLNDVLTTNAPLYSHCSPPPNPYQSPQYSTVLCRTLPLPKLNTPRLWWNS
jgi:hypothetical protein